MDYMRTKMNLNQKFSEIKKKDEGIFFTPSFITEYICKKSIIHYLRRNDKINSIKNLDGNYIIDASGCPSFIKKELGLKKGLIGSSYQQTLENSNFFDPHTVKFFASEKNGYFWIFPRNPKKTEINIGIFLFGKRTHKCKNLLEAFKEENKIRYEIIRYLPNSSIFLKILTLDPKYFMIITNESNMRNFLVGYDDLNLFLKQFLLTGDPNSNSYIIYLDPNIKSTNELKTKSPAY